MISDFYLPEIIQAFSERSCPYTSTDTAVFQLDGEIMPCFKHLWFSNTLLNLFLHH